MIGGQIKWVLWSRVTILSVRRRRGTSGRAWQTPRVKENTDATWAHGKMLNIVGRQEYANENHRKSQFTPGELKLGRPNILSVGELTHCWLQQEMAEPFLEKQPGSCVKSQKTPPMWCNHSTPGSASKRKESLCPNKDLLAKVHCSFVCNSTRWQTT